MQMGVGPDKVILVKVDGILANFRFLFLELLGDQSVGNGAVVSPAVRQ